MTFRASIGLAVLLLPSTAFAVTTEIGPSDDLQQSVNALAAGDELVLRGGTYTLTARFSITVSGTAQAPIVIVAKAGETPLLTRDANQNTVNIEDADYVIFRGIEVAGGSHGIRMNNANNITIEDCHIHDTGDVGISANIGGSSYRGLILRGNHIHDTGGTGEGMYLGCNDNGCQMFDSVIERNWIHDTITGVSQGDGIEIKEGSYNNIVRDNVIYNTKYPCILTYSTVGNGAPNIIERNVLWGCGDYGIQSAADAVIRNNIILSAAGGGIGCQPHQAGSPSNLEILHNTIIAPSSNAVRVSGISGSVVIANNALYAQNGSAIVINGGGTVISARNVGIGGTTGLTGGFLNMGVIDMDFDGASYSGGVPNDVFPTMAGLLVGAGDAAYATIDDFNGTARGGVADIGAYKYDPGGNPGWPLDGAFKDTPPLTGGGGGPGAGSGGAGGGGAGSSASGGGSTGANMLGGDDPSDAEGCSCRQAGGQTPGRLGAWAVLLVALSLTRRRHR